jgi:putative membrane protein
MTMSSETSTSVDSFDWKHQARRLHPFSWLFILIAQLRQFALPLIVLIFSGRGDRSDLWSLIGVGVLVIISIAQYFTYRYAIGDRGIMIRSGLLQKTVKDIPFSKIQNISLNQNILHRLFNVAEVKLESAGSITPEGQMRVVSLKDAHALERLIRDQRAQASDDGEQAAVATEQHENLLTLPVSEVVRLGLISNRGMLVVAAGFGVLAQTGDKFGNGMKTIGSWLFGQFEALHLSVWGTVIASAILFGLAIVVLRVFSVVLALLQFYGFQLTRDGRQLSVERGLLTRSRGHIPRHRLQAFFKRESWLHRLFKRQSLQVDMTTMQAVNESRSMRDLIPLAEPAQMQSLIAELIGKERWPLHDWKSLHPRAWRRMFTGGAVFWSLLIAVGSYFYSAYLLAALPVMLPLQYWLSVKAARHSAFVLQNNMLGWREGWIEKQWRWIEVHKIQAIELLQGPLDRRHGMADIRIDSCGSNPMLSAFRLRYLDERDARELHALLTRSL